MNVGEREKKAIDQSFRLRLHSSLRQSGDAFGVAFYGTAEAVPFRKAAFSACAGGVPFCKAAFSACAGGVPFCKAEFRRALEACPSVRRRFRPFRKTEIYGIHSTSLRTGSEAVSFRETEFLAYGVSLLMCFEICSDEWDQAILLSKSVKNSFGGAGLRRE